MYGLLKNVKLTNINFDQNNEFLMNNFFIRTIPISLFDRELFFKQNSYYV